MEQDKPFMRWLVHKKHSAGGLFEHRECWHQAPENSCPSWLVNHANSGDVYHLMQQLFCHNLALILWDSALPHPKRVGFISADRGVTGSLSLALIHHFRETDVEKVTMMTQ